MEKEYTLKTVFILEHVHEIDTTEHVLFIGVFDSPSKASAVIEELRDKTGFANHSAECFIISECHLNKYEWKEGFVTWDEA